MRVAWFVIILTYIFFSVGCSSSLPLISIEEAMSYEKAYLQKYDKNASKLETQYIDKFIQPKNKKEKCLVYVKATGDDDRTLKSDYGLYWSGACRNGYAYGYGVEIEQFGLSHLEQIGFYENGRVQGLCFQKNKKSAWNYEEFYGECKENGLSNGLEFSVSEQNGELEILISSRAFEDSIPYPFFQSFESFFSPKKIISKTYPEFSYVFYDESNDELSNLNFSVFLKDNYSKVNGYGIFISKTDNVVSGAEFIDNKLKRYVRLPNEYLHNLQNIWEEAKGKLQLAQKKGQDVSPVREKVLKELCKNTRNMHKVFKEVCEYNKHENELNARIESKKALVAQQRAVKIAQMQRERELELLKQQIESQRIDENLRALERFGESLNSISQPLQIQQQSIQQTNQTYQLLQNMRQNQQMRNIQNSLDGIGNNLHRMRMGL